MSKKASTKNKPATSKKGDAAVGEREKKKRIMRIAVITALAICAVGIAVTVFDSQNGGTPEGAGDGDTVKYTAGIELSFPDWDADISDDERWLEKNRYMTYARDGVKITITDGSYSDYGDTVVFFADYFDTLISGDAERLNGFYSDSYFDTRERYEAFTMQRIYDQQVEYISMTDNGDCLTYVYKISYKILANDGTFRNDVLSDAERPQYYTLTDDGYDIKITDVSYDLPEN